VLQNYPDFCSWIREILDFKLFGFSFVSVFYVLDICEVEVDNFPRELQDYRNFEQRIKMVNQLLALKEKIVEVL
jgi:hypothetical protein